MHPPHAFLLPPGGHALQRKTSLRFHQLSTKSRSTVSPRRTLPSAATPSNHRSLPWPKALLLAASTVLSTTLPPRPPMEHSPSLAPPSQTMHSTVTPSRISRHNKGTVATVITLDKLGVKRDDFLSERELRRRKTTQFSEAEEEIVELEEWEVSTQWFRDLQVVWAAVASIAGIFVLYKGGVMWENWIKEQEQKDMEEEIELTGTFIDPRAVRKDEDDNKGPDSSSPPSNDDKPGKDPTGDSSAGADGGNVNLESLEKLFGNS